MHFDLGVRALHKFMDMRKETYIGTIEEDGPNYGISIKATDFEGEEVVLHTVARQLVSQSYSYEIGDSVIVLLDTFAQNYILGLASELENVDLNDEFRIRLGKNVFSGKKDGSFVQFKCGDDKLTISHDAIETKIEATGLVTVTGDAFSIGNAIAPALNACTVCPLTGVHASTVPTINIG